ncbi:ABC transporter ATP-binding protein [Pelagibius sp. Alg239-R121]|uniref:ABC transporter ATP-binding protein n=1 Tax=Pelagibius sp. Alg239-R121 TaxID=2993448 RepID=UPI002AC33D32|nr:ABC transporter ATP-binding protein [Pelagibius sp. Alg239-R121]
MTDMTADENHILRAEKITMRFGGFTALNNVSVAFPEGQLTAIIGPNGAGKSTFFNVISGAFPPSEGRIVFRGREITGTPQHRFTRLGIAKSFQITNVFPQLTALENVRFAIQCMSQRFNIWTPRNRYRVMEEQAAHLLEMVELHQHHHRLAMNLAHGEQRALEIALALACDPSLLLLDEPTAGMSPEETIVMMDLIIRLAGERTVILVEHKMKLVMGISNHLIVLHHGELLAEGTPDEVRANDEVRRVYLGQGEH